MALTGSVWSDLEVESYSKISNFAANEICSTIDEMSLSHIIEKYEIPLQFFDVKIPREGEKAVEGSERRFYLTEEYFRTGLRLPFCSFFRVVCNEYRMAPGQLTPQSWKDVVGFVMRCREVRWTPLMVAYSWHRTGLEDILSMQPEGRLEVLPSPYLALPLMSIVIIARECGWRNRDSLYTCQDPCLFVWKDGARWLQEVAITRSVRNVPYISALQIVPALLPKGLLAQFLVPYVGLSLKRKEKI